MYKIIITLVFILSGRIAIAQSKLNGTYRLHGVQEMAAIFSFEKDGRFEFFYSYGAVDRTASGTYVMEKDTLKLKSVKEGGKDFSIVKQEKKENGIRVVVIEKNKYLLRHILAIAVRQGEERVYESDENGLIAVDLDKCDQLFLQHQLFPDVLTPIKDSTNTNNYFEVALSPSLAQVSFKGIDFVLKGDELTCLPNYFLPMENIRFEKE